MILSLFTIVLKYPNKMNKKDFFPHAVTVFTMVTAIFPMCFGRTDLAIYVLLNAICVQLVLSNMKDQ